MLISYHHYKVKLNFLISVGDGRQGYPEEAPFNAIHVGAAAPDLPKAVSRLHFNNYYKGKNSFFFYSTKDNAHFEVVLPVENVY